MKTALSIDRIGGISQFHRLMIRKPKMTPEEREKFRQGLRHGWSPFEPPPAEPKA